MTMRDLVVAVDVGTGSARAGILDRTGRLLGRDQRPIEINRPQPDHAEQSSEDIWQAVGASVRGALQAAGVGPDRVAGISFDATCSLVVLDSDGASVSVSTTGDDKWDIIVWLDHRAVAEAAECTASGHRVLDYVGGVMSPEMETPKLMWLKRHLPQAWSRAGLFLDLADFLTYRATGRLERSECTVTCKWTYLAHESPGLAAGLLRGARGGRSDRARLAPGAGEPDRHGSRPTEPCSRRGSRAYHRLQGRCGPHRRACRRSWRAGRHGGAGSGRPRPQHRADRRNVHLPHGPLGRAAQRAGRLGSVFRRRAARALAQRRRSVGDRRAARPCAGAACGDAGAGAQAARGHR